MKIEITEIRYTGKRWYGSLRVNGELIISAPLDAILTEHLNDTHTMLEYATESLPK